MTTPLEKIAEEKTGNYQSSLKGGGGVPRIGKRPIYFRFFLLKASLSRFMDSLQICRISWQNPKRLECLPGSEESQNDCVSPANHAMVCHGIISGGPQVTGQPATPQNMPGAGTPHSLLTNNTIITFRDRPYIT